MHGRLVNDKLETECSEKWVKENPNEFIRTTGREHVERYDALDKRKIKEKQGHQSVFAFNFCYESWRNNEAM